MCRVIYRYKAPVIITAFAPAIQFQVWGNSTERIVPNIRLEMSCIKRIIDWFFVYISVLFVVITQRTVKLLKCNIATLFIHLIRTVCIAVVAVQFIVRVIVIQCGADILCVGLGRKGLLIQLYNTLGLSVFSFFAFFSIAGCAQFIPIAAAVAALVDYIITGVGVETRLA